MTALTKAKKNAEMLAYLLPTVKKILSGYMDYPEQLECLENFSIDVVAIADAENSYRENIAKKMILV